MSANKFTVVFANKTVALAGARLESLAIEHPDRTSRVFNYLVLVQHACGGGDAAAIRAEHGGQEIVRHGQKTGLNAILGHEQPARETFIDFVEAVAGGRLGDLHAVDNGKTAESQEDIRNR